MRSSICRTREGVPPIRVSPSRFINTKNEIRDPVTESDYSVFVAKPEFVMFDSARNPASSILGSDSVSARSLQTGPASLSH
jgi:hypothetical protein